MTFERYLRLSSFLLIATGLVSILITSSYTLPVCIGLGVAALYGWLGERLSSLVPRFRWFWNVAALVLLAYFTYDSFFGSLDLVGNGIVFVVYLQTVKLLMPKRDRDWLQIYSLSFLHLLSSTVLSSDLAFALPFVCYIVLAAWTLSMFNLKLAQQESVPPPQREAALRALLRSREVVTSRYLATVSLLSVGIILITLVIFFTFPRLSMGQFLKRVARTQKISGFSEQVELGTIGSIKTNNTIAFRVEIPEDASSKFDLDRLYWRGSAADLFDGRKWIQSTPEKRRVRLDLDKPVFETGRLPYPGGRPLTYTVFLEALSTPVIFAADRLSRITWSKTLLERIFRGSIYLEQNPAYQSYHFQNVQGYMADLTYQAESIVGEPDPKALRSETGRVPSAFLADSLKLPPLHPDVTSLLRSIPLPETTLYDRVTAISRYLETHYRYTLDVEDTGTSDPLRFFFLETKRGHCEYFATAMVMALRLHGIPSRIVMGFRGGELNPYGSYVAVRQRDAHSWVEVFFPRSGWIPFDPSPSDAPFLGSASIFRPFLQFADYLRLRWDKYIVEWDLRAQASIIERIGRRVAQMSRGKSDAMETPGESWKRRNLLWGWPGKGVLLLSLLFLAFLLRRHLWGIRGSNAQSRYRAVLRLLAARGYQKTLFQTAEELCIAVEQKEGPLRSLRELTRIYYD
jgi:transglutaminase-like putative cysteine protease